jgi:hypothetical protein
VVGFKEEARPRLVSIGPLQFVLGRKLLKLEKKKEKVRPKTLNFSHKGDDMMRSRQQANV